MRRRLFLENAQVDPQNQYLTFKALESGTFSLNIPAVVTATYVPSVSYSLNGGRTWTTVNNSSNNVTITTPTVNAGAKVLWKSEANSFATSSATDTYSYFSSTGKFDIKGNIMSLLYGDDFENQTNLKSYSYTFTRLFFECQIIHADELVLPATGLTGICYGSLFRNCSQLITAPELPATKMTGNYCYSAMFYGCSSLTVAPELPATTLTNYCYNGMFSNCSSLITPPSTLPATTLKTRCYSSMFTNCTSLTATPAICATTMATSSCTCMFSGSTSMTTAPELTAETIANYCYYAMFYGCTNLTTAPSILPATALATCCYRSMFYNCSSLTESPKIMSATMAASACTYMFYNCSQLTKITCFATDISEDNCTYRWVSGVQTSNGTFIKHDSMTDWTTGNNGIPTNWVVQPYYSIKYLTFISSSDNNVISFSATSESIAKTISASTDNGNTWTEYTSTTGGTTIATLNKGDSILLKGNNTTYAGSSNRNIFSTTSNFKAEGNIMSLIYGDNFADKVSLESAYTFSYLFNQCNKLTNAANIILPATSLTSQCYRHMFNNCTSLTAAPYLPAKSLTTYCYYGMFANCSSLTTAPKLPATKVANYCYKNMFSGCTKLTTATNALPSKTLNQNCYDSMFAKCSSLTTAPTICATTLAVSACTYMFSGCTKLATAQTKLSATTLTTYCYYGMFYGCSSLTTAPELPAKTLTGSCYSNMFFNCSKLNYIKALFTTTPSTSYMMYWVSGVATSNGTFVKNSSATWTTDCGASSYPCYWTVQTASS